MLSQREREPSRTPYRAGWQLLQIPGPTNIPGRILNAMHGPAVDQRSPDFPRLTHELIEGLQAVFKTTGPVIIFPASGTGAWEAAIVNTLSPGDRVLMADSGQFAALWQDMARSFGLEVVSLAGDWRHGPDPEVIEATLAEDKAHSIKAVLIVHNETSNGVTARLAEIRRAIDGARHPALLMVDTISSLASIDFRQDEWGVDVAIGGSQKGLMLPPGLSFNALSARALAAAKTAKLPRTYWDWGAMLKDNRTGYFPYTPPMHLFFGLRESLAMLREEGLDAVFRRHSRLAQATREAVAGWGLELVAADPREHSDSVSAIFTPEGADADAFRAIVRERFGMALGTGLGRFRTRVFRIGHMGDCNELMLAGALAGVEMGLALAGIRHASGGVARAMAYLTAEATAPARSAVA